MCIRDRIEGLRWYLEAEGFEVTDTSDGNAALELMRSHRPDLAILDIMMPGIDGIEVCREIRKESELYIMMLSAREGEIDKVRALSCGADDYMTKPFHASELVARVKAMLRRAQGGVKQEPQVYQWNELRVLVDERRVSVADTDVELTSMEFNLLAALMSKPRVVISREQLVDIIWDGDFYGELRLVDNLVYRLREKLTHAGLANCPIVTVRGAGYAFRPQD
jgi:DNA-binding response OmpR family regulator